MRFHSHHNRREEKGVALLLALFALLLISAVGVAIVFMSTGETSIVANERDSAIVWEAAKGGLEEARGRISQADPKKFAANLPTNETQILYITNPASAADIVNPVLPANPYFDSEYNTEWGQPITSVGLTVAQLPSDMQALMPATLTTVPMFKWVRITVKTERSSFEDVDGDGCLNPNPPCGPPTIPISYDSAQARQVLVTAPPAITIVYRATALAVLPNGTTRTLQYDVKPGSPIPGFPGALTVCGPSVNVLSWTSSANWVTTGNDAATPPGKPLFGIADCSPASQTTLFTGAAALKIPPAGAGCPPTCPSVANTSATMGACLQSYSCLQSLVATLSAAATSVNPGGGGCPGGTAAAPVITLYTAPMSCTGGGAGWGIMVAKDNVDFGGNFTYNGIILIVGTGSFTYKGTNTFNGAIFVANTSGPGPALGVPTLNGSGGGIGSINYNSALINQMNNLFPYNVLAAREISQ
jgi:hypothetical protein